MALGVVEVLRDNGDIDPDDLARVFARNYIADPMRATAVERTRFSARSGSADHGAAPHARCRYHATGN
jgi:hypothetical protein